MNVSGAEAVAGGKGDQGAGAFTGHKIALSSANVMGLENAWVVPEKLAGLEIRDISFMASLALSLPTLPALLALPALPLPLPSPSPAPTSANLNCF